MNKASVHIKRATEELGIAVANLTDSDNLPIITILSNKNEVIRNGLRNIISTIVTFDNKTLPREELEAMLKVNGL